MKQIGLLLIFLAAGCTGERPKHLGAPQTGLSPCPDSPNCVSSESGDPGHRIEPLQGTIEEISRIIKTMERSNIIVQNDQYLYAEFTSAIMRFVDDAEFLYDPVQKVVQVRSASRLGKSDLGVNRKRIEFIRSALNQQQDSEI